MASFQPVHPTHLISATYDGRTAFIPAPQIFASPISYGNLPFGPRELPPHTTQYRAVGYPAPYAGPNLAAYRPTPVSSFGSLLPQVNLVGSFAPGFPAAPHVPSDFHAPPTSDKIPQRPDFPPAGAPVAQSGAPSRQRQSQPRAARHVQSSGVSRASGSSVPSVAPPAAARKEEPRKRRVIVRFPPDVAKVDGTTTKRSPLSREAREAIERTANGGYLTRVALAPDALVSRDRHFDEIRSATLPKSLDVYLPGREAWQDVWDDMQESCRAARTPKDDRFLRHLRRHSHEEQGTERSFRQTRAHARSTSLFSSASDLPPRLRSAVESLRRGSQSHRVTASMPTETSFSPATLHLGRNAAWSTQPPPAFAAITSDCVKAPPSWASNRTDVTGIASLSASESTAGEVDEPLRRQTRACDEPWSARRDEIVMPDINSDESHYVDAELTESYKDVQDRRAELPSPKRRQPRESTPSFPPLELADLAMIRDPSRAHDPRPLLLPFYRQKSSPDPRAVDGTAGLSYLSTRGSASLPLADLAEPGCLSDSPASPPGVGHQPLSPNRQLNATACDFVPATSSSKLANPAPTTVADPAADLRSSQSSTRRRPLPPLPTAAPPKRDTESRGSRVPHLPQSDAGYRPYPALELIHPQPRRPLSATPMAMSSPSPSPSPIDEMSATSRDRPFAPAATDHDDIVNRSSLSLDDPLPEQYKPPRSVPRGRLIRPAGVPSGAQGALASDFVESDLHAALLGRVTEASPARMGDPRALSTLDTTFRSTQGGAAGYGNHPPVDDRNIISTAIGSPPSFDKLLAEHFEGLQAKVLFDSAETRAGLALLADGLKAVTTKQETFIVEVKEVLLAQHSSLIDLMQALSLRIDAIPQAVSTTLELDLREKVILDAVRPIAGALPTILEELHALRNLLEQRLPCTPLNDDLGTSASTLVKSVDLTEMLPVQPSSAQLVTDVFLESDDALAQSGMGWHPAKARVSMLEEESALQDGRTIQRYGENGTLREAQDAAVEREDILGKPPRPDFRTNLSCEGSGSGERLFAAADVSEDSDDEPTDGTAGQDVFHGDVVPQYAVEEHAYACSSDGWYSRTVGEEGHAFL